MSPETLQVMVGLFALWGVAVAVKAFLALRGNKPYVFGIWDGGMIRAGKRLNRTGKQIKVGVGIAMFVGCGGMAAHVIPYKTAFGIVLATAVISIISDFSTAEPDA
jgi:hypothetical protein